MSVNALSANLPTPVRDLVNAVVDEQNHLGKSEAEQKEVKEWISKASNTDFVSSASLPTLNSELLPKTYLVGNSVTAADVVLYGSLHPVVSKLNPADYYAVPALTRYFDHIQHEECIRSSSAAPTIVNFDIDNAPKQERKAEAPVKKKKDKKEETADAPQDQSASTSKKQKAAAVPQQETTAADESATPSGSKKKEKAKKEPAATNAAAGTSKKGEAGKPAASSAGGGDDSGDPIPSMIDLRVGHIVDIKVHPDADGLYVEQIDLGEETGPRTVISGLVKYIPIEKMRDRYIVAVCNLKPANMRGIKSHAMVLCATSKDGKDAGIELVEPPAGSMAGERVFFEGFEDKQPVFQLNPKKKIFETIQPGFITLDSHEAAWVDPNTKNPHRLRTKDGVCIAPTFIGASLS
ncbi:nucleic acid-binding protein [Serendipita vermifera]|nr:nucleic acid-binding protein [Serendipita vermifera]